MAYNTIMLKSLAQNRLEKVAAGAITPGHLVKVTSSDAFIVHPTVGGAVIPIFALEDELQGKVITDAYASTDRVQANICQRGDEVNAILATSQTIIIGDYLESAGDGTLAKAQAQGSVSDGESYPNRIVATATEAVTTTGAVARICVRII